MNGGKGGKREGTVEDTGAVGSGSGWGKVSSLLADYLS